MPNDLDTLLADVPAAKALPSGANDLDKLLADVPPAAKAAPAPPVERTGGGPVPRAGAQPILPQLHTRTAQAVPPVFEQPQEGLTGDLNNDLADVGPAIKAGAERYGMTNLPSYQVGAKGQPDVGDVENLGIALATAGLGAAAKTATGPLVKPVLSTLSKLVSLGFTGQAGVQTYRAAQRSAQAFSKGDYAGAAGELANAGLMGGLTAMGIREAGNMVGEKFGEAHNVEAARLVEQERQAGMVPSALGGPEAGGVPSELQPATALRPTTTQVIQRYGRGRGRILDPTTGDVAFDGTLAEAKDWLQKLGVSQTSGPGITTPVTAPVEPIPVTIKGKLAHIEELEGGQARVVDAESGRTLYGGAGPDVQTWLHQNAAQNTPTPEALDAQYAAIVNRRAEVQSRIQQIANQIEGAPDEHVDTLGNEARQLAHEMGMLDANLSDVQRQRAKFGAPGTQLPQGERPVAQQQGEPPAPTAQAPEAPGQNVGIQPSQIVKDAIFESPEGKLRVNLVNSQAGTVIYTATDSKGRNRVRSSSVEEFQKLIQPQSGIGPQGSSAAQGAESAAGTAPGGAVAQPQVGLEQPQAELEPSPKPVPAPVASTEPTPATAALPTSSTAPETSAQPQEKPAHEFSSTQVNLPQHIADPVRAFGQTIPKDQLQPEKGASFGGSSSATGLEKESHITLKYGLKSDDHTEVAKKLEGEGPITATLGKASIFHTDDADVLKVDVESPDLHRLNGKAGKLPNGDEHPTYTPHVTIAYLKKGEGDQYDGKEIPGVTGQKVSFDTVSFRPKKGQAVDIPLAGNGQSSAVSAPSAGQDLGQKIGEIPPFQPSGLGTLDAKVVQRLKDFIATRPELLEPNGPTRWKLTAPDGTYLEFGIYGLDPKPSNGKRYLAPSENLERDGIPLAEQEKKTLLPINYYNGSYGQSPDGASKAAIAKTINALVRAAPKPETESQKARNLAPPRVAPPGPIPSGHFMNEGDIDQAVERHKDDPVLSRATRFLSDFREETNAHSDGWPYWKLPIHAAAQLMGMIQHPEYATEENFRKALTPIRAFYTRRGTAAGMKFPELSPVAGEYGAKQPPAALAPSSPAQGSTDQTPRRPPVAGEHGAPSPTAAPGTESAAPEAPSQTIPPIPARTHSSVVDLPVSSIHVDAPRFQFKANVGQGGAGEELRGVGHWDAEMAGVVLVWRDPADHKTYIVNGHNRLALAQRTGTAKITARYLDAKTAAEARVKGALVNIAEGRGDAIDAAKVFRDGGFTEEALKARGVSVIGKIASEGMALAKLDPHLFSLVVSGDLPAARGAVIGAGLPEHADQRALYDVIQKRDKSGNRLTNDQIGEMIRLAKAPETPQVTETQGGLFGEEEVARSLIAERAEVSDYVRKQLGSEKRLFGTVGTEAVAGKLGETGNVIKPEENAAVSAQAAQALDIYDKLSARSGPVADALGEAASALAGGQNAATVKQTAYTRIRKLLVDEAVAL